MKLPLLQRRTVPSVGIEPTTYYIVHTSYMVCVQVSGRSSRKLSRSSDSNLVPLGLQQKASSDSNLIRHFLCHRSSLTVDREEYVLGSGDKVIVLWDIQEDVTSNDWIGLFLVGESSSGFHSFSFFRYCANFHRWHA